MTEWTFEQNHAICDCSCPEQKKTKEVIITKEVLDKITTLTRRIDKLEWMAMLQGHETETNIVITQLTIPEQEATPAHIELTSKGDKQAQETRNIGWIHSHNNMDAFFSKNDYNTASQNKISIVLNNKLEMKALTLVELTCKRKALIETKVHLEVIEDPSFIKVIKDRIKEKIINTVTKEPDKTHQTKLMKKKTKELEGIHTGWTGTCTFCQTQIKEYEESVFTNNRLYHLECLLHTQPQDWPI